MSNFNTVREPKDYFNSESGAIKTHTIAFLIGIIITVLGILYTVSFDILSQYSDSISGRLYAALIPSRSSEFPISELGFHIDESENCYVSEDTVLYIIVLDKSTSSREAFERSQKYNELRNQYKNIIQNSINLRIANPEFLLDTNRIDYLTICKAKICQTLISIEEINSSNFCIWTIGDEAGKKFPSAAGKYLCPTTKENIDSALHSVSAIADRLDGNTNFVSLFNHLLMEDSYRYKKSLNPNEKRDNYNHYFGIDKNKHYSVVLVLISDLVHSMVNDGRGSSYDIKRTLEKNKDDLCRLVKTLSEANTFTNIILVSASDEIETNKRNYEIKILPILNQYFSKIQLSDAVLSSNKDELLYSLVRLEKKCLVFYYMNPSFIENSTFNIKFEAKGEFRICLFTGDESFNSDLSESSFSYNILNSNGDYKNDRIEDILNRDIGANNCRILPNTMIKLPSTSENEILKITYSGLIPSKEKQSYLAFYNNNTKKFSIIPIFFIRSIPLELTLTIYFLVIISLILLFLKRQ